MYRISWKLLWQHVSYAIFLLFSAVSCSDSQQTLPGYIEGEYTYISSSNAGELIKLAVQRGQFVKSGTLLFDLDNDTEKANVEVIKANIESLQAQISFAKIHLERQKSLFQKNAASKEALELAQTDLDSKTAQLAASRAQLNQMQWELDEKTMYAPIDALVVDTYYRIGENVQEYHPVLSLLAPSNIKVLFYVPETQISKTKLGQTIRFSCDGCEGLTQAKITYISPEAEYTPPVIYSKDTRYKLVYLVRASLPKDIAIKFHPGQPIDVSLHDK